MFFALNIVPQTITNGSRGKVFVPHFPVGGEVEHDFASGHGVFSGGHNENNGVE